jgi:hypothetical protein
MEGALMTAPKNDKARKAWLAGLKDGDEVAVIDSSGEALDICAVRRTNRDDLFTTQGGYFTLKTGRRCLGYPDAIGYSWLVPVTQELRDKSAKHKLAGAARMEIGRITGYEWRYGKRFTDAQILAVSAILWPEVK